MAQPEQQWIMTMAVTPEEIDALVTSGEDAVDAAQFATSFDVMWNMRLATLPGGVTMEQVAAAIQAAVGALPQPLTMQEILAAVPKQRAMASMDAALAGNADALDMSPKLVKAVVDAKAATLPAQITAIVQAELDKRPPPPPADLDNVAAMAMTFRPNTGDPVFDGDVVTASELLVSLAKRKLGLPT